MSMVASSHLPSDTALADTQRVGPRIDRTVGAVAVHLDRHAVPSLVVPALVLLVSLVADPPARADAGHGRGVPVVVPGRPGDEVNSGADRGKIRQPGPAGGAVYAGLLRRWH